MNDFIDDVRSPLALDIFCGAGGMSLGFQMAGYTIGLGIDNDPLACQTYAYNFGSRCVQRDIAAIADPIAFIQEQDVERVDVLVGGPPCQGFSRVGRGKLRQVKNDPDYIHDPRNQMYRQFVRFVIALRPLYFVVENVPDMRYYKDSQGGEAKGWLLESARPELERLGYTMDQRVLLAAQYGVPQTRNRLFIVGNRLGKPIVWPKPSYGPGQAKPYRTVWDAISDLPVVDIKHRQDEIPYVPRHELNEYQRLMREECNGMLYNHQTRWHNPQDLEAFAWMPEGGKYKDLPTHFKRYRDDIFQDKYRKLVRSEPSWTVEAHIGRDTYRHIYPSREGEPEPPRTISVREAARLQSFPDRFRFLGAFTQQFHQVGNAVPPLLARAVAEAIFPDVVMGLVESIQVEKPTDDDEVSGR